MHKDRFKGMGSFEDDLYTSMLKGLSNSLVRPRSLPSTVIGEICTSWKSSAAFLEQTDLPASGQMVD